MSDTHGMVWWSELLTRDVAGAKEYYGKLCGWQFQDAPMPNGIYTLALRDGAPTVGMLDMSSDAMFEGMPPHWFTYLAVDDVDAAVAETRAAGGQVMREPFEVPGTGRIAVISDPGGAAIGIMTPEPMDKG